MAEGNERVHGLGGAFPLRFLRYSLTDPLRNDRSEFAPATMQDGTTTPQMTSGLGVASLFAYWAKVVDRAVPTPTTMNASPLTMTIPVSGFTAYFALVPRR